MTMQAIHVAGKFSRVITTVLLLGMSAWAYAEPNVPTQPTGPVPSDSAGQSASSDASGTPAVKNPPAFQGAPSSSASHDIPSSNSGTVPAEGVNTSRTEGNPATSGQGNPTSEAGSSPATTGPGIEGNPAMPAPSAQPAPPPPPKPRPPKPGNWRVPDVTKIQSPLSGSLPSERFSDQVRSAANKLVSNRPANMPPLPDMPERPSLRPGDAGDSIPILISHLTALGYYTESTEPDQAAVNTGNTAPAENVTSSQDTQVSHSAGVTVDNGPVEDKPSQYFGDGQPNQPFENNESDQPANLYTDALVDAVKKFQKEHGLVADGIVGPQVAAALNVRPEAQAEAMRVWANAIDQAVAGARNAGGRYLLLINVPSYTLHVIRVSDGIQVLESPVIVGSSTHQTPIFWTRVVNLKVSPDWVAPQSISKTWSRTPPGPNNPLGLMRFSTNNPQAIYLHDTNHPWMFDQSWRARSHGCIRVKNWPQLATTLGDMTPARLQNALNKRLTTYLNVRGRILVRTIDSRTDLVNGRPGVWPDPYNRGNKSIGALSLQGQPEADPATRFSTRPNGPLGTDDKVSDTVGAP